LLLYSTLGDLWTYDSRVTYSFMPDGTSIGGTPSVLFQTMNAHYPTATWEQQFEQAASLWENVSNANLALVPDGGEAVGCAGDQQDDPRFGDIRIGAVPLGSGILAETFLPPPANGGTDAGDILFNSNVNWQINSTYDIMTVAAHEFGHALGLGGSTVSTAVMYGTYNGIKQALASDDIAGIQAVYGTRQFDQFNNGGQHNNAYSNAANLNSYITSNGQISLPGLVISTSNQSEWFTVGAPSSSCGTMAVTVQSSNLSSLSPKLQVYNSSLSLLGTVSAPSCFGATITFNVHGVQPGQQYYFKVLQAGGPGPIGAYGLLVNFGNQPQSPIPPPNTVVSSQPDVGGGVAASLSPTGPTLDPGAPFYGSIGNLMAWVTVLSTTPSPNSGGFSPVPSLPTPLGSSTATGASGSASVSTSIAITALQTSDAPAVVSLVVSAAVPPATASAAPPVVVLGVAPNVVQAVDDALDDLTSDS
jgi:hypothetical protein